MKKATIYTNANCGYCTTIKNKFKEKEVEFVEKERAEYTTEWMQVSRLTGLPTFPTIEFNGNYYVPGRDYNNPDQIEDHIKHFYNDMDGDYPNDIKLLEAVKTLTYTLTSAFTRLNQDLQQLKQQTNGNKSTD